MTCAGNGHPEMDGAGRTERMGVGRAGMAAERDVDDPKGVLVLVPARLASVRLPGKPLAPIAGVPMIVQVWRRAIEAEAGDVVVACAEEEIAQAVRAAGGRAVLTDPALASGTDRIFAALQEVDPERRYQRIVNLQGDMPTLDPAALHQSLEPLDALGADIATLVNETDDPADIANPNVVKAVVAWRTPRLGRALYFTRASAPGGAGPVWHHIGLYAFRREALDRFAALQPSPLERREKLEQLRALEADMTIGVRLVDAVPFGVDTPADLERARAVLERRPAP